MPSTATGGRSKVLKIYGCLSLTGVISFGMFYGTLCIYVSDESQPYEEERRETPSIFEARIDHSLVQELT
jgi:hypothetical protein